MGAVVSLSLSCDSPKTKTGAPEETPADQGSVIGAVRLLPSAFCAMLTTSEMEQLEKAAAKDCAESLSAWVRDCLLSK